MNSLTLRQHAYFALLLASYQLATAGAVASAEEPSSRNFPIAPIHAEPCQLVQPDAVDINRPAQDTVGCLTPEQHRDVLPAIQDVSLDVLRGPGQPPRSCFSQQQGADETLCGNYPRWIAESDYHWKAFGLFSNPLYFEDVSLERYGQECCVQNALSGAKFFGTVAILPYKMGVDLPCEHEYKLGYIRPGNCAPPVCEHLPVSLRGWAFQAGTVTGIGFLFP